MGQPFKNMKKQAADWEKIFVKYISGTTFISSIYKKRSQQNNDNPV